MCAVLYIAFLSVTGTHTAAAAAKGALVALLRFPPRTPIAPLPRSRRQEGVDPLNSPMFRQEEGGGDPLALGLPPSTTFSFLPFCTTEDTPQKCLPNPLPPPLFTSVDPYMDLS